MTISQSDSFSVIPVDLGASLTSRRAQMIAQQLLFINGWTKSHNRHKQITEYMGSGGMCFEKGYNLFLITTHGFGAFVLKWESELFAPERPFRAEVHCWHRQHIHRDLRNGDSALFTAEYIKLVHALRSELRNELTRKNRRYFVDRVVHYAMTTHFLHDNEIGEEYRLCPSTEAALSLCLDPSQIKLEDSEFMASPLREQLQVPAGTKLPEHVHRVPLSASCVSFASWSSVIVHGVISEEEQNLVLGLQVRTQIGWLAAWVTQDFANTLLSADQSEVSPRRVAWQRAEMKRLWRLSVARTTSSESTRIRSLRRSFEQTSGLNEEWELAQATIESASEYADLVSSDLNHKRITMLEILLLILSGISLVQVMIPTPIHTMDDLTDHWPQFVIITAVLMIGSMLIVTRRR